MDGISDESVAKSLEGIKASYAKNVGKGRITQEQMDQAVSNISITSKIEDVADCDFIIECVYEDAELKDRYLRTTQRAMPGNHHFCQQHFGDSHQHSG